MTENFLNYKQSWEVKELGFNEPCIKQWHDYNITDLINCVDDSGHPKLKTNEESWADSGGYCISAPLKSQFFKWVREKYGILGVVNIAPQGFYYYDINKIEPYKEINQDVDFDSFEEAEDECINHIIKLIKKYYDISSRTITKYTKK